MREQRERFDFCDGDWNIEVWEYNYELDKKGVAEVLRPRLWDRAKKKKKKIKKACL